MRKYRIGAVAAGLVLAVGATACNPDSLTGLNTNPNSPTDAPAGALFTSAARTAAARFVGNGFDLRQTEFVAQHLAEVQYPDEDRYQRLRASDTQGTFDGAYVGELEDLRKVVLKGTQTNDPGLSAPAQILMTWDFGYLTDTWGDVPYSAALRGDSVGSTVTPAYDAQKDIYTGFFATLSAASAALSNVSSSSLGSADIIYHGDTQAWQRLANSLHARFAMRLSNVDPTTASAELTAAFTAPGGLIETNADNAQVDWPGDGLYDNPWSVNFQTRDDHRMSQTLMNIMVPSNDPRVPIYAQPTVADPTKYAGMPNGLDAATAGTYFNIASRPGVIFYPGQTAYGTFGSGAGKSYPSYMMTAAEVLFIEAEAAERGMGGLSPSQAQGFYNAAITASLAQWGAPESSVAGFLAQPAIAYKTGGTQAQRLTQIAIQKWVALYGDGANAWAEWRRTCQPSTIHAGPAAVLSYVPRRFRYSTTEQTTNTTELNAAIARQGPDDFGTRVYWDSKPSANVTCN